MKTAGTSLAALLSEATTQLVYADLITLTLRDGSVLRYTSAPFDIVSGGSTFAASGPALVRGAIKRRVGVSTDTMTLTVYASSTMLLLGTPLLAAIARGALDGARVLVQRDFRPDWASASTGVLWSFSGRVAEVAADREQATLTVKSDLELLNVQVPRNVYSPGCLNTVYDGACGVSRASKTITGTVVGTIDSAGRMFLSAAGGGYVTDYWALGVITMTSGACAGVSRVVRAYDPSGPWVKIVGTWPAAIASGDAWSMYPGCDGQPATCSGRFGNLARYRGMPYVPQPETAT